MRSATAVGERRRGEGAGGHDDVVPIRRRQSGDLLAPDVDQRMGGKCGGHGRGKTLAVDRQRAAGRNLIAVGGVHDQGAEPAHFLVQKPDRVVIAVVRAERVGTDKLGK